jgi:phosphatidylserine decarboxylase
MIFSKLGATNVGSVQVYVDDGLKTNIWRGFKIGKHSEQEFEEAHFRDNNIRMDKGELVGQFNMGSTIVLVFEAPENFR